MNRNCMNKPSISLFLFIALLISGCAFQANKSAPPKIQSCQDSVKFWVKEELAINPALDAEEFKEHIMGVYCGEEILPQAKITTENGYKINVEYTRGKDTFHGPYLSELRPSVDWIKDNLPNGSIITSWWDYGAMIRGISQKDAIVASPSKEMIEERKQLDTTYKPAYQYHELSDHSAIVDVARILVSKNSQDAIQLMNKYNSQYLFITKSEVQIANAINRWVAGDYSQPSENVLLFLALYGNLDGFELIYSDDQAVIYTIS